MSINPALRRPSCVTATTGFVMKDRIREHYDWFWGRLQVQDPSIWPSWDICKQFLGKRCLEIGCGNYPRIPLENASLLDLNEIAVSSLRTNGFSAVRGTADSLPFKSGFFDLTVAWDVMEHVVDDRRAFAEVSRVLKPGGYFLISLPLKEEHFGSWDTAVGHLRRYEICDLDEILTVNSFRVVKFRGQSFLKHVNKMPFLLRAIAKLASALPKHNKACLMVPNQFWALLIRGYALLERALADSWKTGQIADIGSETNITILCQKE